MGVDREIRSVRAFARFRAMSDGFGDDDLRPRASRRVRRIVASRDNETRRRTYLSSLGIAVETYPTLIVCARAHDTTDVGASGDSVSQRIEVKGIFLSHDWSCVPPPHTHRRAHRRKEINHSIVDESIDERVARTFTASLLRRRRRRRRGRAVHGHRPGVASHASTHRSADRRRIDSTRCAATRLDDRARVVLRGWWSMVR